jgi:Flp pilus assembly pilin Flp
MHIGLIKRFLKDEKGATAIEYALIAGIIGIGIVASLGTLKLEHNIQQRQHEPAKVTQDTLAGSLGHFKTT